MTPCTRRIFLAKGIADLMGQLFLHGIDPIESDSTNHGSRHDVRPIQYRSRSCQEKQASPACHRLRDLLRGQYTATRKVSFPSCRIVVTVSADHAGETSETR